MLPLWAKGWRGSQELCRDQLGGHCPTQAGRGGRQVGTNGPIRLKTAWSGDGGAPETGPRGRFALGKDAEDSLGTWWWEGSEGGIHELPDPRGWKSGERSG